MMTKKRFAAAMTVLSLCILTAGGSRASERPETERRARSGRLAGTWRVQITLRVCQTNVAIRPPFAAMATFATGGTMTTADSGFNPALRSAGHGVWQYGSGSEYSAVAEAFLYNAGGAWTGTQRLVQTIELAPDGRTFEAKVASSVRDTTGNVLMSGCATSAGERLE